MSTSLVVVSCPFCGKLDGARYHALTKRFLCVGEGCRRFGEVVDYTEVVNEIEAGVDEFFKRLPGLAPGNPVTRVERVARHLIRRQVNPALVMQLVTAWAATFTAPPLSPEGAAKIVDRLLADRRRAA